MPLKNVDFGLFNWPILLLFKFILFVFIDEYKLLDKIGFEFCWLDE